jgi:hypothetical protein
MDQAHPDQGITQRTVAGDDISYFSPCSGVAFTMKAAERSQFALGQLVALGISNLHSNTGHACTKPLFNRVTRTYLKIARHRRRAINIG